MKKLFILFYLLISISGCIKIDEPNFELSQRVTKNDIYAYKFTQWKCFKSNWLHKYKKLVLTVGFFPEFQNLKQNNKIGILLFNHKNFKKLAIYSRKGVQNYWDWGGRNFNNYQIIIHPSGNAWFYDFENAKPNEQQSPKETYDCKKTPTNYIAIKEMSDIINELGYVPNLEVRDFRNILEFHMLKCFELNLPTKNILKNYPKVSLQFFLNSDGNVNKINFLDRSKYESNNEYKFVADIASKAVMNCKYLPIPKNKIELFKNFIIDFDPNFIFKKFS